MAGEWIKWVKGLNRRRETLEIAGALGKQPKVVAATLMEVWEWADSETTDGVIPGLALIHVDRVAGIKGFGKAMTEVGSSTENPGPWLEADANGLRFKAWDKHNSASAKKRAENTERQRKLRDNGATSARQNGDKSVTREREEREKRRSETSPPAPARAFSAAIEAEQPLTQFHIATMESAEGVFGSLSANDRRKLSEWTISVEASPPVQIDGKPVSAIEIATEAIAETIRAEANGSLGGFLAFAQKCIERSRRQGVRPGVSKALKPTEFQVATYTPREDFDGCLPGETTFQAMKRRGQI